MKRVASAAPDIERDPFHEAGKRVVRWRTRVLGARFEFTSDSDELLSLAREAFAHLPPHRWPRGPSRSLRIDLRRTRGAAPSTRVIPPRPRLSSGAGLLCGHVDADSFAVIDPRTASAFVQVGDAMLRHRQLVRYELIEFAAITLAARTQGLVPLHAGCVGARGRGILLIGSSGSGKSTLALHAALGGLEFLAEDSVFVQPTALRATGIGAFVHARPDALRLIEDRRVRQAVRRAPRIRRRSGVEKHEIDLRGGAARLAPEPLRIIATVVLSARRPRGGARLKQLTSAQLQRILRSEQGYAMSQPGWPEFERRILRAGRFQLDRASPADGVAALRELLGEKPA